MHMQTMRLPRHPEELDLPALNQRLRAGEICLDWTNVETHLSSIQISFLLAGLDLYEQSAIIGIDTVPSFLQQRMLAVLQDQYTQKERQTQSEIKAREMSRGGELALWLPEGTAYDIDATLSKQVSGEQDEAELVLQNEVRALAIPLPEKREAIDAEATVIGKLIFPSNRAEPFAQLDKELLDMHMLATTSDPAEKLQPLIIAYEGWIRKQEVDGNAFRAQQEMQRYRLILARMKAGISTLKRRQDAAQAFAFMNRTMWLKCMRTAYREERQRNREVRLDGLMKGWRWQPLQLAFLLITVPGLTDLHHRDRSEEIGAIADLLCIATDTNKNDVYLGLAAYTLAIRRLQGRVGGRSGEEGVGVSLRYTLRMLASEQFQQVCTLICACEFIRQSNPVRWGETPFRLGLWVGLRLTPEGENTEGWQKERAIRHKQLAGIGTAQQLTHCPWCGEKIKADKDIEVKRYSKGRTRTLIYCSSSNCPFSKKQQGDEGLPILLADEEIYRLLPGLIITSVDTNAYLPSSSYSAARPPDLIVQDELYPSGGQRVPEAAGLDYLATWEMDGKKVRPKMIAASTVQRNPNQQIHHLFNRSVSVFPPKGR